MIKLEGTKKKRKVNVTTLLIAADSRVVESVNINYKF